MTDDESDICREALDAAKDAMLPPDDPSQIEPDYPADMTPEERVEHVLKNEYPRWRGLEWIAAAADTDVEQVWGIVRERLSDGEVEVSDEGVRRNRYYIFHGRVSELAEDVDERPRSIW